MSQYDDMPIVDLFTGDREREVYATIFGPERITAEDIEVALAGGYVLPHGLLEAASLRLGISVDVGSDFADQP